MEYENNIAIINNGINVENTYFGTSKAMPCAILDLFSYIQSFYHPQNVHFKVLRIEIQTFYISKSMHLKCV